MISRAPRVAVGLDRPAANTPMTLEKPTQLRSNVGKQSLCLSSHLPSLPTGAESRNLTLHNILKLAHGLDVDPGELVRGLRAEA
jgi:hypothetical protein